MRARSRPGRCLAAVVAAGLVSGCVATAPPTPPVGLGPSDLLGAVRSVQTEHEDTLVDLAREHQLGYVELVAANPGVDPWLPGAETQVVLPTAHLLPPGPRQGIVINLAEQRLWWFEPGAPPRSFPIGVSREGWRTPLGTTQVVAKRENPTWYPGPSARREDPSLGRSVAPGPDNPLGHRALYLGWRAYLIHGTNEPYGIGRRVSRGCIRLYPEDIETLYSLVPIGTPVTVIDEPVKLGWARGELYLEAHPSLAQAAELETSGHFQAGPVPDVADRVLERAGPAAERVDWTRVETVLRARQGIPVQITQPVASPGFLRSLPVLLFRGRDADETTAAE